MSGSGALLVRTDGKHILFANKVFALGETGFNTIKLTDTDDLAKKPRP